MSARFLTAYLVSAFLVAGFASQLVAGPPDCCEGCKASQPDVVLQVRVINMSHDFAQRCLTDICSQSRHEPACCACPPPSACPASDWNRACVLTDQELAKLLAAAQSDIHCNVQCAPQMRVCNGQSAQVCVSQQQYFVTNVVKKRVGDQTVFMPENKAFPTGFKIAVQPKVSADGQAIGLDVKAGLVCLETVPVPTFPITTFVSPILEGGAVGQPVPFTQFIQQPKFKTLTGDQAVMLRQGRTVVFSGWQTAKAVAEETAVPILCDIPYVGDLFRTKTTRPEKMDVLVLVTPKVMQANVHTERIAGKDLPVLVRVAHTEEEQGTDHCPGCCDEALVLEPVTICPACCPPTPLMSLMAKYEAACSMGQTAEATKLAVQALAIDPMCFSKARTK